LPIPGGPVMTATAPLPAWALSSRALSQASSASRSSSSGSVLAIATMSLIVIARPTVAQRLLPVWFRRLGQELEDTATRPPPTSGSGTGSATGSVRLNF